MHTHTSRFLAVVLSLLVANQLSSQSSSEILHELKKLQNPTRVLYLAAHPDDENTRMISWLVNEVGANTAYLSLTRGDGGQNLIGTELGPKLGVLRTQELMQARRIDGGQQFFTRAVDFGYSKSAKESLEKWGEDEVLSDVVWVIRKFRPDVIITRFPPDKRGHHGHHTASAMLALKAFDQAASKKAFPEQLEYVDTWQPKRIYWNTSTWWDDSLAERAKGNPDYLVVDVGGYDPLMGISNNELASRSRTQHKSQGFGVSVDRGSQKEYLEYLKGEKAKENLFEGIAEGWSRFGFEKGDKALRKIIQDYEPASPTTSLDALLSLYQDAAAIKDTRRREYFRQQLQSIILKTLGWHAEVLAPDQYLQKGEDVKLKLEAISRAAVKVTLKNLSFAGEEKEIAAELPVNEDFEYEMQARIDAPVSQPYWLEHSFGDLYTVKEQTKIGMPENPAALEAELQLEINGQSLRVSVPVTYKYSDRVEGEIIRPVFVTPDVVVDPGTDNMIFVGDQVQDLDLQFRFFEKKDVSVHAEAQGWEITPSEFSIAPAEAGSMAMQTLQVKPTSQSRQQPLVIRFEEEGDAMTMNEISYPHISNRLVFEKAEVPLMHIDLKKEGELIGYIPGAGDEVAQAIAQMGYEVEILTEDKLRDADLSKYRAIVAGIRAYNTQEWLPAVKQRLMEYMADGGIYLVQYNTASRDLLSKDIGPYDFEITRNRVTEEDAEVRFMHRDHPVLNEPNHISEGDFKDWVQERGLYFAGNYDKHYVAPLGWNDEGEDIQKGALIIGNYGKGAFIYTGISFFRELPAGVPGAYRLLANLLSYQPRQADEQ